MISLKLKNQFIRPLVIGAVSAVGAMVVGKPLDGEIGLPLLGAVSKPVFYGVLGATSSLATESVHQWVLPYLPQSDAAVKAENALLSPAIHAALNVGFIYLFDAELLRDIGMQEPIMLGIGSEIVGGYAFESFVAPSFM
jgi:hypothetical protein